MKRIVALLLASLIMLLPACAEKPREHHAEFFIFGTIMSVSLWGATDTQAQQAFRRLQTAFQAMHRDWHAWQPGQLTAINQAFTDGDSIEVSEQILELVQRSQQLEAATGGRFNPTIGALIGLWGFHTSDYPILGPPPSADDIAALVALRPSSLDIEQEGAFLTSTNPAVQLDFGGIAKGYAIDIACRMLRELEIDSAIVNAGGDLRAFGRHGERPWRIAVRAPAGGLAGTIEAGADEAIFTSGNYERFRQEDTERWPHIIDPRNGWPVRELASVTVITDQGVEADAAATALVVAGLEEWQEVARALQLDQVMVIDGEGSVFMTPGMAERVSLEEGVSASVVSP